jgi:ABC-2 type transport system permease protein
VNLSKYFSIFKISFQQEFAYRLNFVMWRVRNVMQIFLIFFLWDSVFTDSSREVFGYNKDRILTYVFGILILRALVFSARAVDIAGEISRGDLTNFLLKPVNYFRYWFTRDLSSKALNLGFAVVEAGLLYLILKPPFFVQTSPVLILLFIVSIVLAILLFFSLLILINLTPFWAPESGWAAQFLFVVIITEFLSGAVFPLDIFPSIIQRVLYFLPFPYLLFFPLQIYLGKLNIELILGGILLAVAWTVVLFVAVNFVWNKGIRRYAAEGR